MTIKTILSASVLAGAVLLSATACAPSESNDNKPEASSTASATPEATTTPTAVPTVSDSAPEVIITDPAETVTGYYNFVSSPDTLEKVKQAGAKLSSVKDVTDADIAKLTTDFPEGMQYFDTSSSDRITTAFNQLFANSTQATNVPVGDAVVPDEAVSIEGDKATVKASMVTVTSNGQALPVTGTPYFSNEKINLVKTAKGGWVMVAQPTPQTIP